MDRLKQRFPHYSALLHLYPTSYRKEYGEQMLQTLADMLDDPERHRTAVWMQTILDLPVSITKQQLTYAGATMMTTPHYIKHNARIGAWMLAPFFLLVLFNAISDQWLRRTLFWHPTFLYVWMILLPAIAILLNVIALLRWIQTQHRDSRKNLWQSLKNVYSYWPTLAIITVGIGVFLLIFWHDSVHCVTGNPIRELRNAHQTLRCIQER